MRLNDALSILLDLKYVFQHALPPTMRKIWAEPRLLLQPLILSRFFMSLVWGMLADTIDGNGKPVKEGLITPHASGVVLDLGAGHGHTANYLDKGLVTKYVALEPNTLMHPHIRRIANLAGFTEADESLLIVSCGAEDATSILSSLNGHQVDTIISVLTLCTIPSPQHTLYSLTNSVLKSGGQFLFYEHVISDFEDVAWWQRFWAPIWSLAFDGCRMDRPSHIWVDHVTNDEGGEAWKERSTWRKEGEPEKHLFGHKVGRYVKF